MTTKFQKYYLSFLFFNMSLAVALGAVGAHALKSKLSPKLLETFLTGNRYHFYISISLLFFVIIENIFQDKLNSSKIFKLPKFFSLFALFTFTLGCYVYALTEIKVFVHIVPFGGFAFILSWLLASIKIIQAQNQ